MCLMLAFALRNFWYPQTGGCEERVACRDCLVSGHSPLDEALLELELVFADWEKSEAEKALHREHIMSCLEEKISQQSLPLNEQEVTEMVKACLR